MCQSDTMNCMTVIVGKAVSETGRVLIAHNEDDPGHVVVRHALVPAADHAPGETIPAEPGLARIPQQAHTLGYYWVEYIADQGGLTAADAFVNEKGVVITSNSMGHSKEDDADASVVRDGGLGYVLRRALAERATSARDGARLLMELVDTWGYAPSGRAYTIADKDEAFMFQLVRGRHYIGARVPDDAVAVMPNHYDFHTLHDCPEMFYSPDIVEYAVRKGWYVPKDADYSDFDFAAVYQAEESWHHSGNMLRHRYGQEIVLGRAWDLEAEGMPFAVYPDHKIGLKTLAEVMSSHYEGTKDAVECYGPGRSPHYVRTARRICTGTTLECQLWLFEEDARDICAFTAFGRPCQVPFVPVHPFSKTPLEMIATEDAAERMAKHLEAQSCVTAIRDDISGRLRRLCDEQEFLFERVHDIAKPVLDGILIRAIRTHRDELAAGQGFSSDEAFLGNAVAEVEDALRPEYRPIPGCPTRLELSAENCRVRLSFESPSEPVETELRFGLEFTHTLDAFASAVEGSLLRNPDGTYSAEFDLSPVRPLLPYSGRQLFYLGGRTVNEEIICASAIIDIETGSAN